MEVYNCNLKRNASYGSGTQKFSLLPSRQFFFD
jgi:hypothetical protein